MWMAIIQQDLKSNNLSLNEAINVAQNRRLELYMCFNWQPMQLNRRG